MIQRRYARGFTLVELLVATTIFLGVSVVILTVLANSEGQKRATTSVNDIDQAGAYSLYQLGVLIRSAGSGFAQNYNQAYGCKLNAAKAGTTILPASSLPDPFGSVNGTFRLAPLVIYKSASLSGSDVLAVMGGNGRLEQTSQPLVSVPTSNSINPYQAYSISPNDLVLVNDQPSGTTMAGCLIEQVSNSYASPNLPVTFGGTYYTAGPTGTLLSGFSINGTYTGIGSISNPPNLLLIGVGPSTTGATNNSLFSYDLLQTSSAVALPIADNVLELHALYGLDTNADGVIDTWQDPGTAPFDSGTLLNGTITSRANLCKIKAVRLGVILRTDIAEKAAVTQKAITLFSGLSPAAPTYNFTASATPNLSYRYRALESTILIRNNMLNSAPNGSACS